MECVLVIRTRGRRRKAQTNPLGYLQIFAFNLYGQNFNLLYLDIISTITTTTTTTTHTSWSKIVRLKVNTEQVDTSMALYKKYLVRQKSKIEQKIESRLRSNAVGIE